MSSILKASEHAMGAMMTDQDNPLTLTDMVESIRIELEELRIKNLERFRNRGGADLFLQIEEVEVEATVMVTKAEQANANIKASIHVLSFDVGGQKTDQQAGTQKVRVKFRVTDFKGRHAYVSTPTLSSDLVDDGDDLKE